MYKVASLIGVVVATFFVVRASSQFSATSSALTNKAPNPPEKKTLPQTMTGQSQADNRSGEPPYKSLILCLSEMDDLLDMIVDQSSFEAIKPRLVKRAIQQREYASEHPNQGMAKLSRAAAKEMQKAVNRHSQSLTRANSVAPGVSDYFAQKLGSILQTK